MTVDVCVIGGGPAGAALAIRLAGLGHHVTVVERHRFPRPHVGESLSPAIWPLLEMLGVRDRVDGGIPAVQARVRWHGDERLQAGDGLTVDRGAFDAILLDAAREAGADVLSPMAARRPVRTSQGWQVPLGNRLLGDRLLPARFLADATGRRRLLGGRRTLTGPRTLALHGIWRGGPAPDGTQTRIDTLAEGWLWGAHLPGGGFRAMAFVDPETARCGLYHRLLAASPLFADVARTAQLAGQVQVCDATRYAMPTPIDTDYVKIGEAAFAIDPLSSSGVHTAIQTGVAGAAAVHSILAPDGDTHAALRYYRDQQHYAVQRHAATAAGVYAEHRAHADAVFWRRRSAPPRLSLRSRAAPLGELLPLRVRLPAAAALLDTPCLVGDRIELRRALTHPALDRPVAFLAGSELAPLLDQLPTAPSLADAVGSWDHALPPGRALAIAAWLRQRGLLEIVPCLTGHDS
ncbi:MAG: flavin-dependent monooxygenase QhpG [Pseudonocardiaceae bacterium]